MPNPHNKGVKSMKEARSNGGYASLFPQQAAGNRNSSHQHKGKGVRKWPALGY
jgi:hypothetical protein